MRALLVVASISISATAVAQQPDPQSIQRQLDATQQRIQQLEHSLAAMEQPPAPSQTTAGGSVRHQVAAGSASDRERAVKRGIMIGIACVLAVVATAAGWMVASSYIALRLGHIPPDALAQPWLAWWTYATSHPNGWTKVILTPPPRGRRLRRRSFMATSSSVRVSPTVPRTVPFATSAAIRLWCRAGCTRTRAARRVPLHCSLLRLVPGLVPVISSIERSDRPVRPRRRRLVHRAMSAHFSSSRIGFGVSQYGAMRFEVRFFLKRPTEPCEILSTMPRWTAWRASSLWLQ